MTHSDQLPFDLRSYRPAAILLLDLVKHSARDQPTTMKIQGVISEVLRNGLMSLNINDAHFNHTGDGYVCTFAGDASTSILDFINVIYPDLIRRLAPFGQAFRGGLAFGLVHFRNDSLTRTVTHFDLPGIEAARLEQAAQSGQILCTVTVHSVFARHYPHMFPGTLLSVQTKDRVINAFEVSPGAAWNIALQQQLRDFLFRRPSDTATERDGVLLVVDDEPGIRAGLERLFAEAFPRNEVMTASTAEHALDIFEKVSCPLVVTDIHLPGMSGIDMTRQMKERSPDQLVIAISGYNSPQMCAAFYQAGGLACLAKPFEAYDLIRLVTYALRQSAGDDFRQQLSMMCDDYVQVWCAMNDVAELLSDILKSVGSGTDLAQELLRHKAKHLVNDGISRLGAGAEPVEQLKYLAVQITCIDRLSRVVGRLGVRSVGPFLSTLIADLRRVHPRIEFILNVDVGVEEEGTLRLGGVVVLAIAELVDNAVAAAGELGRVEIDLVTLRAAGMIQVTVTDNGLGVRADIESQMFDENVSTNGPGRGTGLHLVREAVRLNRGSITYERREGSVFTVRLPIAS